MIKKFNFALISLHHTMTIVVLMMLGKVQVLHFVRFSQEKIISHNFSEYLAGMKVAFN